MRAGPVAWSMAIRLCTGTLRLYSADARAESAAHDLADQAQLALDRNSI
jgi:hypothetical protein